MLDRGFAHADPCVFDFNDSFPLQVSYLEGFDSNADASLFCKLDRIAEEVQ